MQEFEQREIDCEKRLIKELKLLTEKVKILHTSEAADRRREEEKEFAKRIQKENLELNLQIQQMKKEIMQRDQVIQEYENALAQYEHAYKKEQEKHREELENMKMLTKTYQDHILLLKKPPRETPEPKLIAKDINLPTYVDHGFNDTLGNNSQIFENEISDYKRNIMTQDPKGKFQINEL
ncbi:unnamed protein product [Blepharisma stoltei]|uniref:Uncharacterized protein n=1 Tax=Blepharisma stoltei TaxID=1481888 RepID=A0AAU9IGM5_9CILI|nr:unnamed protein product [Blepharisma stoltei]